MSAIAVLERKQDPIQRKRLVKFVVRKTVSAHTWGLLFERLKVTISRLHIFYPYFLKCGNTHSDWYLIIVSTDCIYRDKNSWRTSSNDCLFLLQCKEAIMCQSRGPCSFSLSSWYTSAEIVNFCAIVALILPSASKTCLSNSYSVACWNRSTGLLVIVLWHLILWNYPMQERIINKFMFWEKRLRLCLVEL